MKVLRLQSNSLGTSKQLTQCIVNNSTEEDCYSRMSHSFFFLFKLRPSLCFFLVEEQNCKGDYNSIKPLNINKPKIKNNRAPWAKSNDWYSKEICENEFNEEKFRTTKSIVNAVYIFSLKIS